LLRHDRRKEGLARLAAAFRLARQTNYSYHMRWCGTLPYLCAEALAEGIELDYVGEVIRKYRLRPHSPDVIDWPWPVRIHTLGGFEISRDRERLEFSGKAPRKPLALLKAIIAFGGQGVPESKLGDALWPGEDADTAIRSLDVNLVRLRKLLGRPEVVKVSDERVS
jgi:DNA-binding response OmpR family regulator